MLSIYLDISMLNVNSLFFALACYQIKHTCAEICGYCAKEGDAKAQCGDRCGHSGKHNCRKKPHTWYVYFIVRHSDAFTFITT